MRLAVLRATLRLPVETWPAPARVVLAAVELAVAVAFVPVVVYAGAAFVRLVLRAASLGWTGGAPW